MRWRPADRSDDRGTAAAELAVALPGFVLLLATLLVGGSVMVAQLRCQDAARAGARWAARGESVADVRRIAAEAAPDGADVQVSTSGPSVTVAVSAHVAGRWGAGVIGPFTVSARATAAREEATP